MQELPDLDSQLRRGSFVALNQWLDENVRQYGCCCTAGEMAERITDKRLDANPFLNYLEEKYSDLYK